MRADELTAAGDLAGTAFGGIAAGIHEVHAGISGRVFSALGEVAAPARIAHDGIAALVYSAVGTIGSLTIRSGSVVASLTRPDDAPSIEARPLGRIAVGALNGAFGDRLAQHGSALGTALAIRLGGEEVPPTNDALGAAYPEASPRLAVFLHGLCETEDAWLLHADRHRPYGERLRAQHGYTPLYVRYNTGRHISENGRDLAALLNELCREWPVPVDEIALIGHSMGGLVSRSACHYGAGSDAIARVRHVFSLGSPHRGAQLERLAHAAGAALHRLPETRAAANALRLRSVGIRDLYHGYLVDEDWAGYDPDAFLVAAAREIPFLETASHYFVAATLSDDPNAPVGRLLGDLLVLRPSAWGQRRRTERLRFPIENYRSVGRAHHFDLLNHPAIAEELVRWLGSRPALPSPG
jgi:PGAP1-like protein